MSEKDPILDKLQALCVKREYCESDIYRKALSLSSECPDSEQKAAEMVASLVKDRFVDDRRYSCAYAREKSSLSGWGPLKIRTSLLSKRIEPSIVKVALQEVDQSCAQEKLKAVLNRKWKSLQDDPQGKYKLIRFALSRGYEYDVIRPLVEEIV